MKLFQKQKLKNLVKIDNNFMFYNMLLINPLKLLRL
jgi:hypothetical protein